jgi:glutathione-specific gamma-glutamylcyclotransferase
MTAFEGSTLAIAAHADGAGHADARLSADWVFGYGSLIWDPGFAFDASHLAQVHGYHRTFCIRSTRYRGTPEAPGVVLGLDRGGSCIGMAFRLRHDDRADAIRALYEREMINRVYVPSVLNATLRDGTRIRALAFVANRESVSYEKLTDAEIVRRLNCCQGLRGQNRDYAIRTWQTLGAHGVHCPHLARIGRRLLDADCG